VENKLGLNYEDLGEHQVKNIARPIKVYRVLSYPGAAAHRVIKAKRVNKRKWLWTTAATICVLFIIVAGLYWKYLYLPAPAKIDPGSQMAINLPAGPSLAVLPFDNMSQDPGQEYICDGITETIITVLSHIPKLLVIARNSTFAYKGKPINVQQAGQELGAQYVLEGSVQISADRIRITAQLIDTKSGHHLWSERYDRELKDIFKLQDEIALEVATAMQINITVGEIAEARSGNFSDLDVENYFKYLKVEQHYNQFTKESMILARKELEELLYLYPERSVLHALLGGIYVWQMFFGACESDIICFGKATEAARRSLSLDPNNSDAHMMAGFLYLLRKEFDKAIAEQKVAIKLNLNNSDAYRGLGWALTLSGRSEEAIVVIKKGLRLNPIPKVEDLFNLGWAYRESKQYEKAIDTYGKCLKLQSDFWMAYVGIALSYQFLGREEEARKSVKEALKINPEYSIEQYKKNAPYKNKAELERIAEALRKAGVPE
jgi:adenylate cyclase